MRGRERGAFFEHVVEAAPDGILVIDDEGVIRLVNRQTELLFGWTREELIGQAVEVLVPERARAIHPSRRASYSAAPRTRPMGVGLALTARRADGSEFPVDISLSPVVADGFSYVSVAVRDASDRKQTERDLRAANEQLHATVAAMERQGRELSLVREMADLLQSCVTTEEAYGVITTFAAMLFPRTNGAVYRPTDSAGTLEAVSSWGAGGTYAAVISSEECWALRRGRVHRAAGGRAALACAHVGKPRPGWSMCLPLLAHGELLGLLYVEDEATQQDRAAADGGGDRPHNGERDQLAVTVAEHLSLALANLKLRETLRTQSLRDPLTGLFNRRFADERLSRELLTALREERPLSVMLIDVDHFKEVNDERGHAGGDHVLQELASALLHAVRDKDVVCRLGGDELMVILPDVDEVVARQRAEDCRAVAHEVTGATVSIGVGVAPRDGRTPTDLLASVDRALYAAKTGGRNQVAVAG